MKSIADVVEASGLAGYAEVALLLFFAVFIGVALRALASNRAAIEHAAHLPLDDGQPSSTRGSERDSTLAREN